MFQYGCVWCEGECLCCVIWEVCGEVEVVVIQCLVFFIYLVELLIGFVDGGICVIIRGFNLGQYVQDVLGMVMVVGVFCVVVVQEYEVFSSFVCIIGVSGEEVVGVVVVEVLGRGCGVLEYDFVYQDLKVYFIFLICGFRVGGIYFILNGFKFLIGWLEDI